MAFFSTSGSAMTSAASLAEVIAGAEWRRREVGWRAVGVWWRGISFEGFFTCRLGKRSGDCMGTMPMSPYIPRDLSRKRRKMWARGQARA
jgi:hypothetical protein